MQDTQLPFAVLLFQELEQKKERKKKPYQALSINESHISLLGLSAYKGCFSRVLVGNSVLNLTATNYRETVVVFQIQHILKLSL